MHLNRALIDSFRREAVLLPSPRDIALQQNIEDQYVIPSLWAIHHPPHAHQFYIIFKIYSKSFEPNIEIILVRSHTVFSDDAIDEMSIGVKFKYIFEENSQ